MRHLSYLLLAAVSAAAGYGIAVSLRDDGGTPSVSRPLDAPTAPASKAPDRAPWYAGQTAPPALVRAPDDPIFPEGNGGPASDAAGPRAYEEALPGEIHAPRPPAQAPAVTAPPREVAAVTLPAWRRNAVPVAPAAMAGRPLVAIVIDDMGIDQKRSRRAIDLPAPLTLSFLTYARDLGDQTTAAVAAGHELMVHMAMEPRSATVDPGPNVLLVENDADEIRRRLDWGLGRFARYVGINNHMGSRFTADRRGMDVVMDELHRRGLLFLDSRTSGSSVGVLAAHAAGVPVVERNVFLDNVNDPAEVRRRLEETERLARDHGYAVAIGHPRDSTIAALRAWLPEAAKRGIALVPVSTIVRRLAAGGLEKG